MFGRKSEVVDREGANDLYRVTARLMIDPERQNSYVIHMLVGFRDNAFREYINKMPGGIITIAFEQQKVETPFSLRQVLCLNMELTEDGQKVIMTEKFMAALSVGVVNMESSECTWSLKGMFDQRFLFNSKHRANMFAIKAELLLNDYLAKKQKLFTEQAPEIASEANREVEQWIKIRK